MLYCTIVRDVSIVHMQRRLLGFVFATLIATSLQATCEDLRGGVSFEMRKSIPWADQEALNAFEYLLDEVAKDPGLSYEEQQAKVGEFEIFASQISVEAAPILVGLLLEETRARVVDMLATAGLDEAEVHARLAEYENAVLGVQPKTVEIARQMLFFVAELKHHRHDVYEFGRALGCPAAQLLRHDLSKLSAQQFEGYARYFRGGRKEIDKPRLLEAWGYHQCEEHHHQSYQKEGFSFDACSDERLRHNMREMVADLLAAAKERGGFSTIDWLINVFPKQGPHPRLIPFLQGALIQAHAHYLEAEKDPSSDSIFRGFPCWNHQVEEALKQCALAPKGAAADQDPQCHCCCLSI
jgi:hypothetical protein